jgi:hypothetical protein
MRLRALLLAFSFSLLPCVIQAQLQSVRGTVKDTAGTGLAGAEVIVGSRRATTSQQGTFVVDSLRPGQYAITVRLVGFSPIRSRVVVVDAEPTEVEYFMLPAAFLLPTMVVETSRTGLWGSVGDTGFRAIKGARVEVHGSGGGEVRTDSSGRFSFPELSGGQYMVRATFPGYSERRFMVDLPKGKGRELGILLSPSLDLPSAGIEVALANLAKRLSFGLRRERLDTRGLERFGSLPLCEVPQIVSELGRNRNSTLLLSLDGVTANRNADLSQLCSWRADEVEMIEFGRDICRDPTQTLAELVGTWCSGRARNVPRSAQGGGARIGTQAAGLPYVIIWERR